MIISGDFISLSKGTDYESTLDKKGYGPDLPEGIWFNIRNIVALSCYKNSYRLCIDEDHNIELCQPAANNLIALMRKERREKADKEFNKIIALRNELHKYGYDLKFEHNKDGKIIKVTIEQIKEDK